MKPKLLTSAICIIALFSVDLTYGYHPISPYAYCMGNPIRFVDPDGQDVWEMDYNGRVKWISQSGKHGKIDPVGTDEIDPVKTA